MKDIRSMRAWFCFFFCSSLLVLAVPSFSSAVVFTDLQAFVAQTGPNSVATFEDVPAGSRAPFKSGGAMFIDPPDSVVSTSLVGQPRSFWFKSAGSSPNFYGTMIQFSVVFPTEVNAFGFFAGAFVEDNVSPFTWTLYKGSSVVGSGSQGAASVFGSGFLGVISPVSFQSVTISRSQSAGGTGAYVIDDFRYASLPNATPLTGTITTYAGSTPGAGSNYGGDGGPATSALLNAPFGVAIDQSGTLFIADRDNQRVRKVTPDGVITTVAGNGTAGFSGDGGPAISAQLNSPWAVVVDTAGNLFITDNGNNRIRKVTPDGIITTVAGNGTTDFSGDGGPATSAGISLPLAAAVALDAAGDIFIPDRGNNRIRKVTPDGVITTIAGNGSSAFSGDGGPALAAGLSATAIAVDPNGNIYFNSFDNNRVRKVTPGGVISTVAGNGSPGSSGDGGPATSAQLYGSWGIALDTAGNLFITDSARIRKVTPAGIISTVAGDGSPGFKGDGGPATSAEMSASPRSVAVDAAGNLFIADTGNYRVRKVTFTLQTQFTIPDRGAISLVSTGSAPSLQAGYASIRPDSGSVTPAGIAIFGFRQNNILVSEAGVPASHLISSGRIYAEINGPVNTGLAIANPNNQPATVSYYFTDAGGDSDTFTTTIAANAQIARFLNQAPFNGPASLTGTFTFNSSVPVAAIALRGLTNERGEFLITTLPIADLREPAPTGPDLVLPHFAAGGGWTTEIILVNPGDSTLTGKIQFVDPTGGPAAVTANGQSTSSFTYSIPARASQKLQATGPSTAILSGSVHVTADSGTAPSGLVVFSFQNGGITVSEAGVPAVTAGTAFRTYAEFNGSIQTGIAVANTSSNDATITLDVTNLDGSSKGLTGTLRIPANGQTAMFLNQIDGFASLQAPFQGLLRLSSSSPIVVTSLRGRYNERGDFLMTTTPALNEATPASSAPVFFPQIADSGGFTTQFILFSGQPGSGSSGTIQYFSQAGGALNLNLQ
jgi:hypothetical protein